MSHVSKHITYLPFPATRRFYSSYFYGGESCYTSDAVKFRELILKFRNHDIDQNYLHTDNVWFNQDFNTAFDNLNQGAWGFPDRFKPRNSVLRDAFYFNSIDAADKKWQSAEILIKKIGDYLILRNRKLSDEYLNQPMNIFLLD